jgi:phage replication O-like protein O
VGEVVPMTRGEGLQLEDGYLKIINTLVEAFARTNFTASESRCIWFIIRMTYGYNRKMARIKTAEWEAGTGMKATNIYRTLRRLNERNVVIWSDHKSYRKIGIQKNYRKWKVVIRSDHCDQMRSQVSDQVGSQLPIISERQLKDRGNCPQCGGPKKEDWHRVCDNCYKDPSTAPDRYANLPDCPNCTTKSFTQVIDLEVGGCNFCKPMEVE